MRNLIPGFCYYPDLCARSVRATAEDMALTQSAPRGRYIKPAEETQIAILSEFKKNAIFENGRSF